MFRCPLIVSRIGYNRQIVFKYDANNYFYIAREFSAVVCDLRSLNALVEGEFLWKFDLGTF